MLPPVFVIRMSVCEMCGKFLFFSSRTFSSCIRGPSVGEVRRSAHHALKGSLEGCSASASSRTHPSVARSSPVGCAGARQQPPNSVEAKARCNAQPSCPHHRRSHPARAAARSARGARRDRCCARLRTRSSASSPIPPRPPQPGRRGAAGQGRPVQGSTVVCAASRRRWQPHPYLTRPAAGAHLPAVAKPGSHRSRVPRHAESRHI